MEDEFLPDVEALMVATRTVVQVTRDAPAAIARIMAAARRLMGADRATLWLLDQATDELWTEFPFVDGSRQELRLAVGQGFVGQVAATGQAHNIPFDLYEHPDAAIAKQIDQKTGYRTYSLLCLPVYDPEGTLLGVTQLLNKRRSGQSASELENWPEAPDCFRENFEPNSQKYMQIFNAQVGVALHYGPQLNPKNKPAEMRGSK